MASANVELVRSIFAAWEHGDYRSVGWAHPEIEYVVADGPDRGSWQGLTGMAAGGRANLGAWSNFRFEADEYREIDEERVLVLHHAKGRGKVSGVDVGQTRSWGGASLFYLGGGVVTKLVHYWNAERALADLGLVARGDPSGS